MGTHVIRNITGKLVDIQDFSTLGASGTISTNYVIQKLLQIYVRNVALIHCHPDLIQKFTFTMHEEGKAKWTFEYSNDMMLNHDIITMCYFYYITYKSYELSQCESVKLLKPLLLDKYDVYSIDEANMLFFQGKTVISLLDIAFSFPSVTWDVACNLNFWTGFFDYVSDFDLPKQALIIPFIFPLLPKLEERPPLAVLLALSLKTVEFRKTTAPLLRKILNDITIHFEYKMYPQRLKLELCEKWQIITRDKGVHKYAPCFTMFRHKAKDIIATMKSDDPDLELILSLL
ncbi:uncharacterized protein [Cardiocondyla obscurior]|uniref:uncharacterized protein isoform X2 n=1 Tax=Cardiocondyla obscurior TaxID=286306 RepID=UPI0039655E59